MPLPERWLRGFAEVQVIAAGLRPARRAGRAAGRAVPARPAASGRPPTVWAVPAGRALRLPTGRRRGAVCLAGAGRLGDAAAAAALRQGPARVRPGPTAPAVQRLGAGAARHALHAGPVARAWRGFSGEGAVLDALATDEAADDADLVGCCSTSSPTVEIGLLADRSGLPATGYGPRSPSSAPPAGSATTWPRPPTSTASCPTTGTTWPRSTPGCAPPARWSTAGAVRLDRRDSGRR